MQTQNYIVKSTSSGGTEVILVPIIFPKRFVKPDRKEIYLKKKEIKEAGGLDPGSKIMVKLAFIRNIRDRS